jgi:hypothetical protein
MTLPTAPKTEFRRMPTTTPIQPSEDTTKVDYCACAYGLCDVDKGWERMQHLNGRHHYRAWTDEDGARLAGDLHDGRSLTSILSTVVPTAQPADVVAGRYLELVEATQ